MCVKTLTQEGQRTSLESQKLLSAKLHETWCKIQLVCVNSAVSTTIRLSVHVQMLLGT